MNDATELTTRDVLAQIDRRLSRIEDDVRDFRQYVDERFSRLENKVDSNFRWHLALSLGTWLSVMSAILLK